MIQTKLAKPLFGDLPPDAAPSGKSAKSSAGGQAMARSVDHKAKYREAPSSNVVKAWELPDFKVFKTDRSIPDRVQQRYRSKWADVFRNMRPGDCFEVSTERVPELAGAMRKYLDAYRIPGRVLARSRIQNTMGAVWFLSNETED